MLRRSGKPNAHGLRIQIESNWNFETLSECLQDYKDKEIVDYLKYGWPIGHDGRKTDTKIPNNQAGALQHPEALREYIRKEKSHGAVAGGYTKPPFQHSKISPLDTRKKRDSDELRVILNLSHPYNSGSVNEGISKSQYLGNPIELHYPTVDTLVEMIIQKKEQIKLEGKTEKVLLFKKDLKRAYRWINVDFKDIHLLGYQIDGLFYFDLVLPNGIRSGAYIMQRVSTALKYIFQNRGYDLANFLDDLASCERESVAQLAYCILGEIIQAVGLQESSHKACEPKVEMVFLGTGLNTETMTLFITPDRVEELLSILQQWQNKDHATLREVQSLLGKLNFVTNCVRSSRIYISRILNFLKQMKVRKQYRIPKAVLDDVSWWHEFMPHYNYKSKMIPLNWEEPDQTLSCDSTLTRAAGWCAGEYFTEKYPKEVLQLPKVHINELECLTVTVCLKVWAQSCQGKKLLVKCDNKATVAAVNSGRSKNRLMQACLRELHHVCSLNSCELRLRYIRSEDNRLPDLLSRIDNAKSKERFQELTRDLNIKEIKVLPELFTFQYTTNN